MGEPPYGWNFIATDQPEEDMETTLLPTNSSKNKSVVTRRSPSSVVLSECATEAVSAPSVVVARCEGTLPQQALVRSDREKKKQSLVPVSVNGFNFGTSLILLGLGCYVTYLCIDAKSILTDEKLSRQNNTDTSKGCNAQEEKIVTFIIEKLVGTNVIFLIIVLAIIAIALLVGLLLVRKLYLGLDGPKGIKLQIDVEDTSVETKNTDEQQQQQQVATEDPCVIPLYFGQLTISAITLIARWFLVQIYAAAGGIASSGLIDYGTNASSNGTKQDCAQVGAKLLNFIRGKFVAISTATIILLMCLILLTVICAILLGRTCSVRVEGGGLRKKFGVKRDGESFVVTEETAATDGTSVD